MGTWHFPLRAQSMKNLEIASRLKYLGQAQGEATQGTGYEGTS